MEVTAMTCPNCSAHQWPEKTRGKRVCPQCAATIACTKTGPRLVTLHRFHRATGRKVETATDRFYKVVAADGVILCACCARSTSILHGVDGRIETDGNQKVSVQVGWHHTDGSDVLTPRFADRVIPRNIRGIICPDCQGRFNVRQAHKPGTEDKRPLRVRSMPFNTREQRQTAEDGLIALELARLNGAPNPEDATALLGANWAHTGDSSWLSPELMVKVKRPNGFNTGSYYRDYAVSAQTFNGSMFGWHHRPALILSRKPSSRMADIPEPDDTDILADTVARKIAPAIAGMTYVDRAVVHALRYMLRPWEAIRTSPVRGKAISATGTWTAQADGPEPSRHALAWHYREVFNPTPQATIREYREEQPAPACIEVERTKPLTGRFCSRPLPVGAIPLRLVT